MKQLIFILLCALSSFCLEARPKSGMYSNPDLDELRLEIDDLKQSVHNTQIEISLLDEKTNKQENSLIKQTKETGAITSVLMQVSALEKKVTHLEKTLDKISADLRTLNTAYTSATNQIQQFQTQLSSQDERLNEVGKLKGTLTSIAKAMGDRPLPSNHNPVHTQTYRVKAGDSLEKIAKAHKTTAESIRKINALTNDKIIVGQELKVCNDPS